MNKFDIFEPIFSELGIQKDISKIIYDYYTTFNIIFSRSEALIVGQTNKFQLKLEISLQPSLGMCKYLKTDKWIYRMNMDPKNPRISILDFQFIIIDNQDKVYGGEIFLDFYIFDDQLIVIGDVGVYFINRFTLEINYKRMNLVDEYRKIRETNCQSYFKFPNLYINIKNSISNQDNRIEILNIVNGKKRIIDCLNQKDFIGNLVTNDEQTKLYMLLTTKGRMIYKLECVNIDENTRQEIETPEILGSYLTKYEGKNILFLNYRVSRDGISGIGVYDISLNIRQLTFLPRQSPEMLSKLLIGRDGNMIKWNIFIDSDGFIIFQNKGSITINKTLDFINFTWIASFEFGSEREIIV